jgi:hypothetical protein
LYWQEAIEPFLNALDRSQTRRSDRGKISEAMQWLKTVLIGEITAPPMQTAYHAELVARLDARGAKRLTPSTVARKLAAARSFLRFCRLTSLTRLTLQRVIGSVNRSYWQKRGHPSLVQVQIRSAASSVLADQPCYKAIKHKFALMIPEHVL